MWSNKGGTRKVKAAIYNENKKVKSKAANLKWKKNTQKVTAAILKSSD